MGELIAVMIIAAWCWWWMRYEERDLERRLTAPARARAATRRMELDYLGGCAAAGDKGCELYLQRTLIADLRALRDRRVAVAYLHEHYGLEPREGMGVEAEYGPPPWYLVAGVIIASAVIVAIAVL